MQLKALLTVTLYIPALETVMLCVVADVDHNQKLPAGAVSVTVLPAQTVRLGAKLITPGVAAGLTTTAKVPVLVQPKASVTVNPTLKVPALK